ncbi:MAG: YqgE/AlgH family protein [Anaerolineae bacterium]
MEKIPYTNLNKGSLLIATPDIDSGIYFRSVLLICEHNQGGSFGLMINKSLDIELPADIIDIDVIANPRVEMRAGGPTQPNQLLLLHSSDSLPEQTIKICDGLYLGGDLQFLQEAAKDPDGPAIRLCFGYASWGPGQLEREFLNGNWFLHPASARHVFETPSEKVWQSVLREMGGKYATFSMIPEDLSLN